MQTHITATPTTPRAPYRAPQLTVHGTIQRLTLGAGNSTAAPNTGNIPIDNGGGLNG